MGVLHVVHLLAWAFHQYRRPSWRKQSSICGWLFGPNSGQIFSNVITQPRKHNRDVASLEGPRQPAQHSPCGAASCP